MKSFQFYLFCAMMALTITACGNTSNKSEQGSTLTTTNVYDEEINQLDALVDEIVRLEYKYSETGDESIAERGELKCAQLRTLSHQLEGYMQDNKLTIEQLNRINHIFERLPQ